MWFTIMCSRFFIFFLYCPWVLEDCTIVNIVTRFHVLFMWSDLYNVFLSCLDLNGMSTSLELSYGYWHSTVKWIGKSALALTLLICQSRGHSTYMSSLKSLVLWMGYVNTELMGWCMLLLQLCMTGMRKLPQTNNILTFRIRNFTLQRHLKEYEIYMAQQ